MRINSAGARDIGKAILRSLLSLPALLFYGILVSMLVYHDTPISDHQRAVAASCQKILGERLQVVESSLKEGKTLDQRAFIDSLQSPALPLPHPEWKEVRVYLNADEIHVDFVAHERDGNRDEVFSIHLIRITIPLKMQYSESDLELIRSALPAPEIL